jgi:hypothetical protein
VIDIGNKATALGIATRNGVTNVRTEKIKSVDDLTSAVFRLTGGKSPSEVALSVPGVVGEFGVMFSNYAKWLEDRTPGYLSSNLRMSEERNFHIFSDGDAHALALKHHPETTCGAINFAIDSEVAFGVLNERGNLIRSLSGSSWDVDQVLLHTSSDDQRLWYALGPDGQAEILRRNEKNNEEAFAHFGRRLGSFVVEVVKLFRPRTVGLSGNIIRQAWDGIKPGFKKNFNQLKKLDILFLPTPNLVVLNHKNSALVGLASLFYPPLPFEQEELD